MSSSSNSRTADAVTKLSRVRMISPLRRRLLQLLALVPLAPMAGPSIAAAGIDPLSGLKRWGSGEFRRFGFLVYAATLWAGDDPQRPPFALCLDYKRTIAGSAIAEASVSEMRKFGSDEATLRRWGEQMARLFPDVAPGDFIIGIHDGNGARFHYNGNPLGEMADPTFASRFFAIWLDPRTSAPHLRAALLKLPES